MSGTMKRHVSIMTQEICDAIPPHAQRIVDATLGHAGHLVAMTQHQPQALFRGIDRDTEILEQAQGYMQADITPATRDHIHTFHASYTQLPQLLEQHTTQR